MTQEPFRLCSNATILLQHGFKRHSILLIFTWLIIAKKYGDILRILGNPYENPSQKISLAINSISEIRIRFKMLFHGGTGVPKGENKWIIWLCPKNLKYDLETFVHECWHIFLNLNGIILERHSEDLIDDHAKITAGIFKEEILNLLAQSVGGWQLWFENFPREISWFYYKPNHPWENWYYKRTGKFLGNESYKIKLAIKN